jgi:hypothetical protein
MSLTVATLIPGLILLVLGVPLLLGNSMVGAALKSFPRSTAATYVFFGAGATWFLFNIWNLSMADMGEYRKLLFVGFLIIAVLAFKCVPDFLSVRGLCAIILLGATPLLDAAYMEWAQPQRLLMVSLIYVAIAAAIWLGAQPWRLRDWLNWLFVVPARAKIAGGVVAGYGLLLCIVAFTY